MHKKLFLLFIIFSFSLSSFAGKGGPDKFGYTWKDSYEVDGPVYKWYEIPANTDRVVTGLGDDNVMGPFPIGGKFIYYWYPVDKFWVGANGYISFGNINIASPFPSSLPDSTNLKYNFIAPFMCDLYFAGYKNPAKCLYHITNDSLIVTYSNVPFWSPIASQYNQQGSNTFQIILNIKDRSITFNYRKQTGYTEYNDYIIGIENMTGTMGIQYPKSFGYPKQNYSIKFYYPQNPDYKITDCGIKWINNDETKGLFLPYPFEDFQLNTNIGNFGNLDISYYSVSGKIIDPLNNISVSSNINIPYLFKASSDTVINFQQTFNPQITGTHSFRAKINNVISSDRFSSNDTLTQEIVVIDTSMTLFNLSYARIQYPNLSPTGSISWNGGNGGVAVYFKPPVYPVKLINSNFIITSLSDNTSFYAKIYDDNGRNGMPGTLLDSVLVTSDKIQLNNHKTVVPVQNDIIIYEGGVYVSWIMKGQGISLGVDKNPPFSHQTYENLGGTFAQYRNSQDQDFFIGLDVVKHGIVDLSLSEFQVPIKNQKITKPINVSIWVKNTGNSYASDFDLFYSMNYENKIIETYKGDSIKPGDSVLFVFNNKLFTNDDSIVGNLCSGVIIPNDYRKTNDTICMFTRLYKVTGINESFNEHYLSINPNPFKDYTILQAKEVSINDRYILYDFTGKEILRENLNRQNYIYKASLNKGIYFLKVLNRDKIFIKKLIID